MIKKIIKIMICSLVVFTLASCASTEVEQQPAPVPAPVVPEPAPEPEPIPEPEIPEPELEPTPVPEVPVVKKENIVTKHFGDMLWEIKGTDKNGNDGNIFFFGTISAGDNRIFPIPENVVAALNHSDRVFSELSLEDYNKAKSSSKYDNLSNNNDYVGNKNIYSVISEEECQWLLDNMGLGVLVYSVIEPWEVYDSLFNYQMKKTGLTTDKENKTYFYDKSASLGKTVEALELPEDIVIKDVYGDWNNQASNVKDFIDAHIQYPDVSANLVKKIYQAYVVGDEVTFTETLDKIFKNKGTSFGGKNNDALADKIGQILADGGSSFIFIDITRLVGDNSVFVSLKNKGIIK